MNIWDNGRTGNYWSDYTGTDAIPEFPSWAPTLFILIVLAVAVAIYKRKLSKTANSAIIFGA